MADQIDRLTDRATGNAYWDDGGIRRVENVRRQAVG